MLRFTTRQECVTRGVCKAKDPEEFNEANNKDTQIYQVQGKPGVLIHSAWHISVPNIVGPISRLIHLIHLITKTRLIVNRKKLPKSHHISHKDLSLRSSEEHFEVLYYVIKYNTFPYVILL